MRPGEAIDPRRQAGTLEMPAVHDLRELITAGRRRLDRGANRAASHHAATAKAAGVSGPATFAAAAANEPA